MSTKDIIIRYLFSSTISSGVNFFSKWFLNYALATLMPLSTFGIYSFIGALANIFKGIISFGGELYLIYSISKDEENKYSIFLNSNLLSFIITICLVLILVITSLFNIESINTKYFLYAILLASLMAFVQNIYSFFKGLGRFDKEGRGYAMLFVYILTFTTLLYFDIIEKSLIVVLSAVFLFNSLLFLYALVQIHKYYRKDSGNKALSGVGANLGKFVREKFPYGLHELQSVFYVNATLLVLGFLVDEKDLAVYRSIQIIIVPFSILPMIFSQVLLKQLTEHILNGKNIVRLFRVFSLVTSLIGLTLFIAFYNYGEIITTIFYGDKLKEYTVVNEIIVLSMIAYFFRFVSASYGVLITAKGKQKIRVYATGMLILTTVFGTIILTNRMGIVGAAYANAISYLSLMLIYILYSEYKLLKQTC